MQKILIAEDDDEEGSRCGSRTSHDGIPARQGNGPQWSLEALNILRPTPLRL